MISYRRQFHLKVWPFSEDSTFSNLIAFSMSPLMLQAALQKAISFISVNFNFKTNSFSLTLFSNSSIIFVNWTTRFSASNELRSTSSCWAISSTLSETFARSCKLDKFAGSASYFLSISEGTAGTTFAVLCDSFFKMGSACWSSSGTSMTGLNLLRPKQVSTATQNSFAGPGRKVMTGFDIFLSVQSTLERVR